MAQIPSLAGVQGVMESFAESDWENFPLTDCGVDRVPLCREFLGSSGLNGFFSY